MHIVCPVLTEIDYSCGEYGSILERIPEGKVPYTMIDGEGTRCYVVAGLFLVNRIAVYYGDDMGYDKGTIVNGPKEDVGMLIC